MANNKSNKKVANGLVAMSSAAVLAVYAAGYVRTRPAANRLDAQVYERPLAPEASTRNVAAEAAAPPIASNRPAVTASPVFGTQTEPTRPSVEAHPATVVRSLEDSVASAPKPTAAKVESPAQNNIAVNTAATAADASTISAPSSVPVSTAVPNGEGSAVAAPAATPASTPAPASSSAPAAPAQPVWKDGKYTAWGTCQHGDIQATVVIQGGRIMSADITDCRTRYSCDIIESLPPKVITRQKNKFDAIGGATESAYAYYGAVYWALDQASK